MSSATSESEMVALRILRSIAEATDLRVPTTVTTLVGATSDGERAVCALSAVAAVAAASAVCAMAALPAMSVASAEATALTITRRVVLL